MYANTFILGSQYNLCIILCIFLYIKLWNNSFLYYNVNNRTHFIRYQDAYYIKNSFILKIMRIT